MRAARIHEITRTFLESHPEEAARVLEHVPPPSAAALLNAVPVRLATEVLRRMVGAQAARCLEHLRPQAAVGLLRALTPQTGAALLRNLPQETRESLLGELPTGTGLALRLLLSYPEDTVGAWADPRVPALAPDLTVKETIDRIRRVHNESAGYVYVVNADDTLRGVVRLPDALRALGRTTLEQLRVPAEAISARTSLGAARAHPGWREFHALAVVDHEQRFVGALHYGALDRALSRQPRSSPAALANDAFAGVVHAYWLGFSGLLRAALPLLGGPRRRS